MCRLPPAVPLPIIAFPSIPAQLISSHAWISAQMSSQEASLIPYPRSPPWVHLMYTSIEWNYNCPTRYQLLQGMAVTYFCDPQEPVWHLEESIHPEIIKWMNEWMNSVLVAQSCLTLCDPVHYSSPDSFVHGILQARILEWVAIPFSRGSFWPRDRTPISCIAGRFFTIWATGEAWVDE